MTHLLSRALHGWEVLSTLACLPGLLACSGADTREPEAQGPQDPTEPREIAGGQSGSEGGGEATPCIAPEVALVTGVITELGGGCATVGDIEVVQDGGVLTSLDSDATLRGAYIPHFASVPFETGQTVIAIYSASPTGAGVGSLRMAVLEGEVVELLWRGRLYDSSIEELTSDECKESFQGRPFVEDGHTPQERTQTPLSCDEEM